MDVDLQQVLQLGLDVVLLVCELLDGCVGLVDQLFLLPTLVLQLVDLVGQGLHLLLELQLERSHLLLQNLVLILHFL